MTGSRFRPEEFLVIEPMTMRLHEIETPAPVIDLDVVERNVRALQSRCESLGLVNRPHAKTHKLAGLARFQIACGAVGVTVQKLGEAEAMADGGVGDMLLTFNIVGAAKAARLARLIDRAEMAVTADNPTVLDTLSTAVATSKSGRSLRVMVECDTGMGRAGVQSPADAAALAAMIGERAGLSFGGLMTYPKAGSRVASEAFLSDAVRQCAAVGHPAKVVSTGGTPDLWKDEGLDSATEYRAGTSIYNDRSLVARSAATDADCALAVHVTVVSRPTATRAIVDAGSKTLSSDLLGLEGHGTVRGHPAATIYRIDEEHGYLSLPETSTLAPGDRLAIVPNHVCPVTNLFDQVLVHRNGNLLGRVRVDARGAVT